MVKSDFVQISAKSSFNFTFLMTVLSNTELDFTLFFYLLVFSISMSLININLCPEISGDACFCVSAVNNLVDLSFDPFYPNLGYNDNMQLGHFRYFVYILSKFW